MGNMSTLVFVMAMLVFVMMFVTTYGFDHHNLRYPASVKVLTHQNYNKTVNDGQTWIVDFYAPWCPHCQAFAPHFGKESQQGDAKVRFAAVNCVAQDKH